MATVLRPICTTVKKLPGWACNASTFSAWRLPSSAITCNLILREAAREISESEKNTLPATSSIRKNKLSAKLMINLLLQPP